MADDSPSASSTGHGVDAPELSGVRLTDTQRAILTALCRARVGGNRYATPATNQEIAEEVYLSVDAIKAHLRALYRKFGVEPLPHNQKRARLVELVVEGGLISTEESAPGQPAAEESEAAVSAPPPASPEPGPQGDQAAPAAADGTPPGEASASRRLPLIAGGIAIVALVVIAAVLAGAFSSGSDEGAAADASTPAQYRQAVNGYCRLALEGRASTATASRAERARAYLGVIATMNDRLKSLAPPPGENRNLALFRKGLQRAADYTSVVAQGPPPAGSRESAGAVAQLTLAAGQVQAGALGYGLGPDCSAIGSQVVASSARNAAIGP